MRSSQALGETKKHIEGPIKVYTTRVKKALVAYQK